MLARAAAWTCRCPRAVSTAAPRAWPHRAWHAGPARPRRALAAQRVRRRRLGGERPPAAGGAHGERGALRGRAAASRRSPSRCSAPTRSGSACPTARWRSTTRAARSASRPTPSIDAAVPTPRCRAPARRRTCGVGYFTSGAAWRAAYDVVPRDDRCARQRQRGGGVGRARRRRMRRCSCSLARCRARARRRPAPMGMKAREMAMVADAARMPEEQRAGEFHLYTLPGKVTLRPGATTTVALFDPATRPVRAALRGARHDAVLGLRAAAAGRA
ncbi:MAG: hypothetical protein MZV64_32275 [Ignavibacteriales bacterium]|nr:hypothetical protein [Ignavibacteriales bacterium]